jgi:hypothetical protein
LPGFHHHSDERSWLILQQSQLSPTV